jgi:hypothetical protein
MDCELSVEIETARLPAIAAVGGETPALRQAKQDADRQAEAEATLRDDPLAQDVLRRFDAQWVPGSMRPTD